MQQVIHVFPVTRLERDLRLNAAVDTAIKVATRDRLGGILVTRHTPAHFTVSTTADVPYGHVAEADDMPSRGHSRILLAERELDIKDERNSSKGSEDCRWERLWEPAARHYRDIEHSSPVIAGVMATSHRP